MTTQRVYVLGGSTFEGNDGLVNITVPAEMDWAATPIMDSQKKTRRTRSTAPVSIPIFAECTDRCRDPFWATIFDEASRGKLPARFSYTDGNLIYKNGGKSHVMLIPNNPNEATLMCIEFMYNHENIMSDEDMEKGKMLRYQPDPAAPSGDSWGELSKKLAESVMANFIENEKKTRNLSRKELQQLRQTINFGQCLKYFHRDTIFMKDFKIIGITGLIWNSVKREYSIDKTIKPKETRSSSRRTTRPSTRATTYGDKWERVFASITTRPDRPDIVITDSYGTNFSDNTGGTGPGITVESTDGSDG